MASKALATSLLTINLLLLFITLSSCSKCPPPPPTPKPPTTPSVPTTPPSPPPPKTPTTPSVPTTPSSPPPPKTPTTPSVPTTPPSPPPPKTPTTPSVPTTPSPPPSSQEANCSINTLKLGVCANVLNLVNVTIGSPPTLPCCSLIRGLVDLEAAVCLCTAIKADVLGINLNLPIDLSLILNYCGKKTPAGFQCA